jgi:capsular polysaccharide transport system permease protein
VSDATPQGPARPIPFKPAKPVPRQPVPIPPPASRARRRPRHIGLLASFLALVLLPALTAGGYLAFRAADQYDSTVAFAVQSTQPATSVNILGGISQLSGASDTQSAMVYEYLQSRDLVAALDKSLNLRKLFSQPYNRDPVFGFDPSGSLEDLTSYWNRMVSVSYDSGTGLITLDVHAFTATDAHRIAGAAFAAASRMINRLSDIAQQDTMRAARAELTQAETRLTKARAALRAFRERSRIIDPSADFTSRMGVISALQDQLASALVDLDMIRQTTHAGDPRLGEETRKIAVIRARIADERQSFGSATGADKTLASLTGTFEKLSSEQDFAEKAYANALGALDTAEAAAREQALYLAAYQKPIAAERAQYPRRWLLTGLVALFGFLIWSVLALIYYSLRDRR